MSKLFEVKITIRAVIEADSRDDAYSAAYARRSEIARDDGMEDIDIGCELLIGQRLPPGWTADCYPYGRAYGQPELRIEQIWETESKGNV